MNGNGVEVAQKALLTNINVPEIIIIAAMVGLILLKLP